jgi:predicted kinase
MTAKARRASDVDRVLLSLGDLPKPRPRPALVIVAGLPGTGKSVFAAQVEARTDCVVLESDAIRRLLFERPAYTWFESRRVFSALHAAARKLLEAGVSCVVDATNLAEAYRKPLYDIAEEWSAKLIVVEVTAPEDVVMARLSDPKTTPERLSEADAAVYQKMRRAWEEIGREHLVVDTSKPTGEAAAAVARAMEDP